jgi:hypothetical protein
MIGSDLALTIPKQRILNDRSVGEVVMNARKECQASLTPRLDDQGMAKKLRHFAFT